MEFYTHQLPTTDVIIFPTRRPWFRPRHFLASSYLKTSCYLGPHHSHSIQPFSSNTPPSLSYPFNGAGPVPSNDEVELERTALVCAYMGIDTHGYRSGLSCTRGRD